MYDIKIVGKILGVIVLLSYGFLLYGNGKSIAEYDLKSYSTTKAYAYKGIYLSLSIPVMNFVVWLTMTILQSLTPASAELPAIASIIGNAIFVIWTFAYNEILSIDVTNIKWYVHVVMYIFPVVFVSLGYFAGYKKWELAGKLNFLVYEKKKK